MKRIFTLFLNVIVALGIAQAADITYDFSNGVPSSWTSTITPNGTEARGTQFLASGTLTLKDVKQATKVVITCSTNVDKKNSMGVKVGNTTFGKEEVLGRATDMTQTFEGTATDGDLVITLTRAEKSIYIKQVVVTCGEAGGNTTGGSDDNDDDEPTLDPSYKYAEPTSITVSGAQGSNTPYSFIQKNILVSTTQGAQNDSYFGCNAGATISFTATQDIKAVVINGYVKKDFEATASAGTISYVDASESEVTANPVVMVTNINAKSVAITCDKQMRCYSVDFYFTSNPDIEIEEGDDDGDEDIDWDELLKMSYEYEPTETTSANLTFTQGEYMVDELEDGTSCTQFALYNETSIANIILFGEIKTGTYTINSTLTAGTALASDGGNMLYDNPCYIGTDWDEEFQRYNNTYYLVSGTIKVTSLTEGVKIEINAKSYNGSTFTVTYTGIPEEYVDDDDDGTSYEWEEETVSTQNYSFEEVTVYGGYEEEYDYSWTEFYMEGENWNADLLFFAESAQETGVAPGTYTIDNSGMPGTVYASPGGDDTTDYPSCIMYDFDENGNYAGVYYLVSGTIKVSKDSKGVKIEIDAKSYNGSTIKGIYTGNLDFSAGIENLKADNKSANGKIMQDGKLYIQRDGRRYNISGLIVK